MRPLEQFNNSRTVYTLLLRLFRMQATASAPRLAFFGENLTEASNASISYAFYILHSDYDLTSQFSNSPRSTTWVLIFFTLLTSFPLFSFNFLVLSSSWLPERPCSWTRGHTESKLFLMVSPLSLLQSHSNAFFLFSPSLRISNFSTLTTSSYSSLFSTPHVLGESYLHLKGPQHDKPKASASTSPAHIRDPKMGTPALTPRFQPPSSQSNSDTMSPRRIDVKPAPDTNKVMQFQFVSSEDISSEEEGSIDRKRNRESKDLTNEHNSLIEDIYNVERREDQPKKRIKTADDENTVAKSKSQFNMSGNSGLGEYMKEGRQLSETATPVVDLTSGAYSTSILEKIQS